MATITALQQPESRRNSDARARGLLEKLLAPADIRLDGRRPWDIRIHDARMPMRVLTHGSLGAGESYMEGWWDCEQLDEMFARALRVQIDSQLGSMHEIVATMLARLRNAQSRRRAFQIGARHYDAGDDLYRRMLDPRMIYSCGYWRDATDLETAQQHKLDLVFRKLGLKPGMRILDIGCGWGGATQYAAQRYGVTVTGITVSHNQAESARQRCRDLPVDIELVDYRALTGSFDRIYSIGMFEHVGVRNYRHYFTKVRELLKPDGLFLLHTIGGNRSTNRTDPWIEKHIFPNSMLPSIAQIASAAERDWVIEDWHSFGPDYDRTLMAWLTNFDAGWPQIAPQYSERFRRMWRYYLSSSAAAFRARSNQLWQVLMSPNGIAGGVREVR
jgi:cyclopropane-fatty-acyl-phospholipid synthase